METQDDEALYSDRFVIVITERTQNQSYLILASYIFLRESII